MKSTKNKPTGRNLAESEDEGEVSCDSLTESISHQVKTVNRTTATCTDCSKEQLMMMVKIRNNMNLATI